MIGRPPSGTSGLGTSAVSRPSRSPSPAASITACMSRRKGEALPPGYTTGGLAPAANADLPPAAQSGSALLLRGRFLERSQFAPHVAVAAKAFSDVAGEGQCADRSPGIIEDDRKRKFDIDGFAGSVQRACGKRLAGVLGYARVERFFEAGPVSYA